MKADSILSVLYAILAVLGIVLVYLSAGDGRGEVIEVVVGMGAVILGVLGLEAQTIQKSIRQSHKER